MFPLPILSNIRIGVRLALGFTLVLACTTILLSVSLWRMSALQTNAELLNNRKAAGLIEAMDMREAGWVLALSLRKVAAPTDAKEGEMESRNAVRILERYENSEKALQQRIDSPQDKELMQAIADQKAKLFPVVTKIRTHVAEGNYFDAASLLKSDFLPLHEQWMRNLALLAEQQHHAMQVMHEASANHYRTTIAAMLGAGALTLLAGALIAWGITRTITLPLRRAQQVAAAIAQGDLTHDIDTTGQDEAGQLLASLNTMQANLTAMVRHIKGSAETISVASREIASGNADLSNRTEAQAGRLEETASSMEELTSTVQQNAENATQANQLVASASTLAHKGGKAVNDVITTMASIKSSSRAIADIISVIDGIAFQTNLLALNASVEAARAGDRGRGFAIVAAEVRNLAQRSAAAAREIKVLIEESVRKVNAGHALVESTGATMSEIVTSITYVASFMGDISSASQEQRAGIELVNDAIGQIDDMTQQNAALVEQAAAAAESLQQQTVELTQAVSAFKLDRPAAAAWGRTHEEEQDAEPAGIEGDIITLPRAGSLPLLERMHA